MPAEITVLAGVNGGGKSSVGGKALEVVGVPFFNPDLHARKLMEANPSLGLAMANGLVWNVGFDGLKRAIANGGRWAFETTLGGHQIVTTLIEASKAGAAIHMWFVGLSSPELHIQRVQLRVSKQGHSIPETKIRQRYDTSRQNLIALMPHLTTLRLYDNSIEGDPDAADGSRPAPVLLLSIDRKRVTYIAPIDQVPDWAKAVIVTALKQRTTRRVE